MSFTILSRRNCVCPAHSKGVQRVLLRILKSRGVDVRLETEARGVKAKQLMIKTKDKMDSIPCDEVIWCTNANAAKWFRETDGMNLDNRGFVSVRVFFVRNTFSRRLKLIECTGTHYTPIHERSAYFCCGRLLCYKESSSSKSWSLCCTCWTTSES